MRTTVARWQGTAYSSTEHLVLHEDLTGFSAESVVLGTTADGRFAVWYRILCDSAWQVRSAEVRYIGESAGVVLRGDGRGSWTDGTGAPLPAFSGVIDVDIVFTPVTNTIPIRRLGLGEGESADILVAYIQPAENHRFVISVEQQRYTCRVPNRQYRFTAPESSFVRDLDVDEDGLVLQYPGLFERV